MAVDSDLGPTRLDRSVVMLTTMWGCMWRGTLLGVALGISLGAIYGALLLGLWSVWDSVGTAVGVWDGNTDAWMGVIVMAPYGGIIGAVLGAAAGLPLGLLVGLLAALASAIRALRGGGTPRRYHRFVAWASAAVSVGVMIVAWTARGVGPAEFAFIENTSGAFDDGPVDMISLVLVLTGVVGIAGWWIGRRVAVWSTGEGANARPEGIPG